MQTTPVSLLQRVRKRSDQEAWGRFVRLYTPLIFHWGRKCGLQAEDAADLTQEVFATLFQKLPEFTYDQHGSFRSWLRTLTLNHWRDWYKRIKNRPLVNSSANLDELAGPDPSSLLEESEYRKYLLDQALQLIQPEFQPTTWQAFRLYGLEGRPVEEVAAALGISVSTVYVAKCRVLIRLKQELAGLLD